LRVVMRWNNPVRAGTESERSERLRLSVKKSMSISGRRKEDMTVGDCRERRMVFLWVMVMGPEMRVCTLSTAFAAGMLTSLESALGAVPISVLSSRRMPPDELVYSELFGIEVGRLARFETYRPIWLSA
jgi:hypothetical protein